MTEVISRPLCSTLMIQPSNEHLHHIRNVDKLVPMERSQGPKREKRGRRLTQEVEEGILRLHRQGANFTQIAKETGVVPRTAKAVVLRAQQRAEQAHWEGVMQEVDRESLRRHYDDLLLAGSTLLRAAEHPIDGMTTLDPRELVVRLIEAAFTQDPEPGVEAGLMLSGGRRVPLSRGTSAAERILSALLEHEPQLRRELEEWSDRWDQARQSLGALSVEVKALLAQPPFAELAGVDADSFVGRAIAELQSAEAPRPHTDGPETSQPPAIARDTLEDRFRAQVLFRVRDAGLLDQLHATRDARDQFRDALELLTLRGRPSGRCELCPFAGAPLQ